MSSLVIINDPFITVVSTFCTSNVPREVYITVGIRCMQLLWSSLQPNPLHRVDEHLLLTHISTASLEAIIITGVEESQTLVERL